MNTEVSKAASRYFVGRTLEDLMFEITQILTSFSDEETSVEKVIIKPVNPEPFKLWWEFYSGETKICTIKMEAQDLNGNHNLTWLEWHNDFDNTCFEELYISCFGFPDWVETDEDEEEFFKAVQAILCGVELIINKN